MLLCIHGPHVRRYWRPCLGQFRLGQTHSCNKMYSIPCTKLTSCIFPKTSFRIRGVANMEIMSFVSIRMQLFFASRQGETQEFSFVQYPRCEHQILHTKSPKSGERRISRKSCELLLFERMILSIQISQ